MRTHHFGVLIPATNTTAEIEYTGLLPPNLQPHYARMGKGGDTPFSPSLDADLAYQSRMLGYAKVEVIALLQTSASLFEDGYDARAKASMTEGAGAPALTSAEAIGEALIRLGTRRIGLVSPYSDAVIGRAKHYYESRFGLTVAAMEGFGATDAYAIGALSADHATEAFARGDRADIQAWVVPGGNFPTMRFVAGWERALGKPVITTNQAILWAAMRAMNAGQPLPGLGRLLEQGFG
jgi:maleate cis-trans isomerase